MGYLIISNIGGIGGLSYPLPMLPYLRNPSLRYLVFSSSYAAKGLLFQSLKKFRKKN